MYVQVHFNMPRRSTAIHGATFSRLDIGSRSRERLGRARCVATVEVDPSPLRGRHIDIFPAKQAGYPLQMSFLWKKIRGEKNRRDLQRSFVENEEKRKIVVSNSEQEPRIV